MLSYMKLIDIPLGVVINFHWLRLVDGISRLILPEGDLESLSVGEDGEN